MKKYLILTSIVAILVIIATIFFTFNIKNNNTVTKKIFGDETFFKNEIVEDNIIHSEDENTAVDTDKEQIENSIKDDVNIKNEVIVENTIEHQTEINEEKTTEHMQEEIESEYIQEIEVIGYIKIPKYNVESPIFKNVSKNALNISVAVAYGSLNEEGNTTIFGHAYQNYPFEKISQLENGDKIIITDATKKEITYEIYNKQIINSNDATYMIRNTNGAKEITLQTGDTETTRLIVSAKEID